MILIEASLTSNGEDSWKKKKKTDLIEPVIIITFIWLIVNKFSKQLPIFHKIVDEGWSRWLAI